MVRLTLEKTDITRALGEVHVSEAVPEVVEVVIGVLEVGEESVRVKPDTTRAAGANEVRFRLEFTDRFRKLLAALRAGDRNGRVFVEEGDYPLAVGTGWEAEETPTRCVGVDRDEGSERILR